MKTIVLSVFVVALLLLPNVANAQNDDFFRVEDEYNGNRDVAYTWAITNNDFGAPIGSGLLVLTIAGAGYAVARRKRSFKKGTTLILAFVLMLSFTQCKKRIETMNSVSSNTVYITLDVPESYKAVVNPPHVSFQKGDTIYVAHNGVYVGKITHNGSKFTGEISATPTEPAQKLYFYYLGSAKPTMLVAGTTTSCSVVISDQASNPSPNPILPVISFGASVEDFSGAGAYTTALDNKCALVKFNVTKPSGYNQAGVCIKGMNNKVNVNFATPGGENNGFTYESVNNGKITLASQGGDTWAILLSQNAMGADADGAFSGRFKGSRAALPEIKCNDYLTDGYAIDVETEFAPDGVLNNSATNYFSVSSTKKVLFSKGNLQYTRTSTSVPWSEGTWSFMQPQYTRIEEYGDPYCSADYANKTAISLFGWATSGFAHGSNCYHPYNTYGEKYGSPQVTYKSHDDYYAYGIKKQNLYNNSGKADWGYNAITEGEYKQWRTLTHEEWVWLLGPRIGQTPAPDPGTNCRTSSTIVNGSDQAVANARFAKAVIGTSWSDANRVQGIIVFPDTYVYPTSAPKLNYINYNGGSYTDWTSGKCDLLTPAEWALLEEAGAVFLPAGGKRFGTKVSSVGTYGYYTSASYKDSGDYPYGITFDGSSVNATYGGAYEGNEEGNLVRLVCE